MAIRPQKLFRVWTVLLSVVFAALLLPSIVGEHGLPMSLVYTGLGVGVIWIVFFALGRLVDWAVTEEIKRRGLATRLEGGKEFPDSGTRRT